MANTSKLPIFLPIKKESLVLQPLPLESSLLVACRIKRLQSEDISVMESESVILNGVKGQIKRRPLIESMS